MFTLAPHPLALLTFFPTTSGAALLCAMYDARHILLHCSAPCLTPPHFHRLTP